jgi:hypothetical protein
VLNGIGTSNLPTIGRGAGSPSGSTVINLDRSTTADLWAQGTTQAIQQNPGLVASAVVAGYSSSGSRAGNPASVLGPPAINR